MDKNDPCSLYSALVLCKGSGERGKAWQLSPPLTFISRSRPIASTGSLVPVASWTAFESVRMNTFHCFSSPRVLLPVETAFSWQNFSSFWIAAFSGSIFFEKATLWKGCADELACDPLLTRLGDRLGRRVFVAAVDDGVVRESREFLVQGHMHLLRLAFEEATASADEQSIADGPHTLSAKREAESRVRWCGNAPGKDRALVFLLVFHIEADVVLSTAGTSIPGSSWSVGRER